MKKRYQLPEHRKLPVPAFFVPEAELWEPCAEGILPSMHLPCGLVVRCLSVDFPPLADRRMLFFSDLHIRSQAVLSVLPYVRIGAGIGWVARALRELTDKTGQPDMVLFGGDLAAESAWIEPAVSMLADAFPQNIPKLAAVGNWEMRRIWLKEDRWAEIFAEAGFRLVRPQDGFSTDKVEIRTLADYKEQPQSLPAPYQSPDAFHCVLMHNPDAAVALRLPDFLKGTRFMFAGHTHGGQLRLPGYGALLTSSRLGKKFEYGLYRHKVHGTKLFVSAGIGTTWIPLRFLCPPEVVLLTFR